MLPVNNQLTMTSVDFWQDVINPSRESVGEKAVRYNDFIARVKDELDTTYDEIFAMESTGGRSRQAVTLNYDQMMLVGMRESKAVRKAVLVKLHEMGNPVQPQLPDFTNPAAAARAWAEQFEQNQIAQQQLIEQKPKIEFVDNFVEVGTTKTLRETAKILKYPERAMIAKLIDDKVLYRQSGNLLPYQNRQAQGLFEVKTGERNNHAYTQTRVTTKGIEWLASRYASELLKD